MTWGLETHPLVYPLAARVGSYVYFVMMAAYACVVGVDLIHLLVNNAHSVRRLRSFGGGGECGARGGDVVVVVTVLV